MIVDRASAASEIRALPEDRYLNRELSWLEFNARVLALAEDERTPVLERVKFLSIFASNLDEFYMVRVAGLRRQQAAEVTELSVDGLSPGQQLEQIADRVGSLMRRHASQFIDVVMPALAENGIVITHWSELSEKQQRNLSAVFHKKIFPILTPLAVDPGHPFPYISNRSLSLAVLVKDRSARRTHFARVKVPPLLSRFMAIGESTTFVPIEDVIAAHLEQLFPGMEILEHHSFRVVRDAELEVDDEGAEDLLRALEKQLARRRATRAVRLEVDESMPSRSLALLKRELQMDDQDIYALPSPLDLSGLIELYRLDRPELKDIHYQPVTPPDLTALGEKATDIFAILREKDVLLHHPYESFGVSTLRFIQQAAADPDVLAIKQTLYRTSGESPIVDALIEAAESGKQVVVLVEITARFDELANINWARKLERAGCHVVYGIVGLKTHCKLCMVIRREGDELRRYVHVGTGNYNPTTARIYEDLGLLTADEAIGTDVGDLFNYLTGYSRHKNYSSLIVAPYEMRDVLIALIERLASRRLEVDSGRIVMKLNHLVDEHVIDALYRASMAGVQVDLMVRGMCSIRPGVPNLSEKIRVRSVLGRYLEHSRVYCFSNGETDEIYIGSADVMHRNLDRRVEVLVKVESPPLKEKLVGILDLAFADNCSAWVLDTQGGWTQLHPGDDEACVSFQTELMRRAVQTP